MIENKTVFRLHPYHGHTLGHEFENAYNRVLAWSLNAEQLREHLKKRFSAIVKRVHVAF